MTPPGSLKSWRSLVTAANCRGPRSTLAVWREIFSMEMRSWTGKGCGRSRSCEEMNLHMHPRQLVMADGGVSGRVGAQPLALAAAHLCSIYGCERSKLGKIEMRELVLFGRGCGWGWLSGFLTRNGSERANKQARYLVETALDWYTRAA